MVEVCCEFVTSKVFIEQIIDIDEDYLNFGETNKIQKEYCTKIINFLLA